MAQVTQLLGVEGAAQLSQSEYEILRAELDKEVLTNPQIRKILEDRIKDTVGRLSKAKAAKP